MKIGSLNIRGLGSEAKKDEIASVFFKNSLDILCVQETKMESFSEKDGLRIWKSQDIKWSVEGAIGRSGGVLTCWNDKKFSCIGTWSLGGAVVINGWWNATKEDCCIINVYAPCNAEDKNRLWDRLSLTIASSSDVNLCIIGDFNSILTPSERMGSSWSVSAKEIKDFQSFISSNRLIDIALQGRKFTWYRTTALAKVASTEL